MLIERARNLPRGWRVIERGLDGEAYIGPGGLRVIISTGIEQDNRRWLHVSLSYNKRLPGYRDIRLVKALFVGADAKAIEVHPAAAEHVNIHPYVRHLFHCLDGDPLPDFTRGTGSI